MPTIITVGGGACKGFGLTSVAFPRKPIGLAASNYTLTGFTLSWTNDPLVTSYKVSNDSGDITGLTLTNTSGTWSTVIDNSAYTPNTAFNFYVTASNAFGSTPSSPFSVKTNAAPPTGLSVSSITVSSFSITWTSVASMTYTLWQGTTQVTGITINPAGTAISGLGSNSGYTYYVKAANAETGVQVTSAGVAAVTLPAAPTVGTITESNLTASVAINFTTGGGYYTASSYTVRCVELNVTVTGSSPVYFGSGTGFVTGSLYTFTASATTAAGTSAVGSASSQMRARVVLNYTLDSYSNTPITNTVVGYTNQIYAVVNLTLTGSYVGSSTDADQMACIISLSMATGATLNVINNALIYGHDGYWSTSRGEEFYSGGDALSLNLPCTLVNNGSIVGGGGRSAVTSSTYGYTGGSPGPPGGRAVIVNSSGIVIQNYNLITGGGGGGGQGGSSAYYPGPSGGGSGGNGGTGIVCNATPTIYNYGTISGGGGAGGAGGGGAGDSGVSTASINGYAGTYGNTYLGSQSYGHGGKGGNGAFGSTAGLGAEGGNKGQNGGTAGAGQYGAGSPGSKGAAFSGGYSLAANSGTINY